jgi:hypothetical protein
MPSIWSGRRRNPTPDPCACASSELIPDFKLLVAGVNAPTRRLGRKRIGGRKQRDHTLAESCWLGNRDDVFH